MSETGGHKWFFGKMAYPEKDRNAPFTPDEVRLVKAGDSAVYFHGRVCYFDIFKEIRSTDFCIYWAWKNCGQGNDAD
jgi:hypothetical protein